MADLCEEDLTCMPKNALILNALATGVAIQILAKITGEPIEVWKQFVGSKADEQYRSLSAKEIQEILDEIKKLQSA
jgi:hypothetical protein